MSDDELIPYDLTAEPKVHVLLSPGWEERLKALTPCVPDYCNICENFPCLGSHPPGAEL